MKAGVGQIHYYYDGMLNVAAFKTDDTTEAPGLRVICETARKGSGRRLSVRIEPLSDLVINDVFLEIRRDFTPESRIFCNGYQSWTESREFAASERIPSLLPGAGAAGIGYQGDSFFRSFPGGAGRFHGYTWFYVREGMDLEFIGSLTENNGFTIFETDCAESRIIIRRDCSGVSPSAPYQLFDLVMASGSEAEVFAEYWKAMKTKRKMPPLCTGWTSRNSGKGGITGDAIMKNLGALAERKVPVDIVVIDEGYQSAAGDWLDKSENFSHGMGYLSSLIHDSGFRAGIWLAPFICEKKSKIFREKNHWILRDRSGRPCTAGEGRFLVLDFYNGEVRAFVRRIFDVFLNEWEYDILKVDYLYAAGLCPPAGKSRGQVIGEVMKFIRECAGKKEIMACGVPLGSAFGLADYCQAGSEPTLKWEDHIFSFINFRERASTVNSIVSTQSRYQLDGNVFRNATGAIALSGNTSLAGHEQYTLLVMNSLFGGMVFASGDISGCSDERISLLRSMFPFREKRFNSVNREGLLVNAEFSIGDENYLVLGNLSGKPAMAFLPAGIYFTASDSPDGGSFLSGDMDMELQPHTTLCFLRLASDPFRIAGTTGHIFPGSEIKSIRTNNRRIRISLLENAAGNNTVYIRVPSEGDYYINGKKTGALEAIDGLFVVKAVLESEQGE